MRNLPSRFNPDDCAVMLERVLFLEPSDVCEVRVLAGGRRGTEHAGYFDSSDALLKAVGGLATNPQSGNFFVTLNQVDPELKARAYNRMKARSEELTKDTNILRRRWIFVDIDPVRASGISSSEAQLQAGERVYSQVFDFLVELGFSSESLATMTSGNGFYILVRCDLPNDEESRLLVEKFLKGLGSRFDCPEAHIDTATSNASRVAALCGTIKAKGDNLPDAPHRPVRPFHFPELAESAPLELLQRVAALAPLEEKRPTSFGASATSFTPSSEGFSAPFDMERFIGENAVAVLDTKESGGFQRWYIQCPFCGNGGTDAYLMVQPSGAPGFKCSHNSCKGNHWRELIERTGWKTPKSERPQAATQSRPRPLRERTAEEKEADAERTRESFVGVVGDRVEIESVARQDREILADTWTVLKAANESAPTLFVNQRGETRLFTKDLNGNPYTQPASADWLSHVLRELADWVKLIPKGRGSEKVFERANARFPSWVPRDILNGDTKKTALPYLRAVVGCPVVTSAGELLTKPGYDKASGLYLVAPETRFDPKATPADAQAALDRIMALFADFPFASKGDRANAAGLLLTPFLRHYISGPAPLFVVEAPTPGTGKTLLASALLSISTPGFTFTDGPSERERGASEEWSKHLGAILAESPSAVLLDNLRGMISSGTLEGFLTNPGKLKLRILGKSEMQEVDASGVTMAATGNNALFQHDMTRRSCFIRLDANMERPEDRTTFSISDLLGHVKTHRAELLADVVIILSAWLSAGRPDGSGKKGSFERWAAILSGVLEICGVSEFLSTDSERAAASDPEADTWRGFFQEWGEKYSDPQPSMDGKRRTKSVTAKELTEISVTRKDGHGVEYTQTAPGLAIQHEVVPERSSSKSVGKRLQAARGRVFGGWRLCVGDDPHAKTKVYWLEESAGFAGFAGFNSQATRVNEEKKTDIQCEELQQNPANPANPADLEFEEGSL
ncbi:hypothetical protein [Armatimonas sp.]|uniref:hypothetical protein n=1 Tax=Armatimonas sp. TaxID=1872638 RepID=UPI00374CB9F0